MPGAAKPSPRNASDASPLSTSFTLPLMLVGGAAAGLALGGTLLAFQGRLVGGGFPPWVVCWLTPAWLIGVGCLIGLLVLGLLLLVPAVVGLAGPSARRFAETVMTTAAEGPLVYLHAVVVAAAVFGAIGVIFTNQPGRRLADISRLLVFDNDYPTTLAATPPDQVPTEQPLAVDIRKDEVRQLVITSDQPIELTGEPGLALGDPRAMRVAADDRGQVWSWRSGLIGQADLLPQTRQRELYLKNLGDREARVRIHVDRETPAPEVWAVPLTAIWVVVAYLAYLVPTLVFPRLSAVALATFKAEVASMVFWLLVAVGSLLIFFSLWTPFYTFGDDIRMMKQTGFQFVLVLGLIQAIWAASNSVSEEIEGRTALTLLSKPITRRTFVVGKFLGIAWSVAVMILLIAVPFLLCVGYKPVHDSKEASASLTVGLCYEEMISCAPGLTLSFLECVVLAAVSVAAATRVGIVANFVISFAIYIVGNIAPLLVASSERQFPIVAFVGKLIATFVPVLDHFNIQAAVAAGVPVPTYYLATATLYCALYSAMAMFVALLLFEDRDLS